MIKYIHGDDYAVMYDSQRMECFGPVFSLDAGEWPEDFVEWCERKGIHAASLRLMDKRKLQEHYLNWRKIIILNEQNQSK